MSYLKNKPNSLEDMAKQMNIHTNESGYKEMFKKELDKTRRAGVGAMTPKEKNEFFRNEIFLQRCLYGTTCSIEI